jgi:hypothetical protein
VRWLKNGQAVRYCSPFPIAATDTGQQPLLDLIGRRSG